MKILTVCLVAAGMILGERVGRAEPAAGEALKPKAEARALWTYQDFLDGKIPPRLAIRPGHPRLLITPENKAEMVEKIKAGPALWQQAISKAEDRRAAREDWQQMLACGLIYQMGLVPGFKYALTREEYGQRAVGLLAKQEFSKSGALGGNPKYHAYPIAYDWVYDLLTAEQKKAFVDTIVKQVRSVGARQGMRPYALPAVNSVDNQALIVGLAFHGDGVDDAAAREIVEGAWKEVIWDPRYSDQCITDRARTVLYLIRMLEGGGNDEGINYFSSHEDFPVHAAAWKTAAGVDVFSHMGYFRNLPYWLSFMVAPRDDGGMGRIVCLHGYCWGYTLWYGSPSVSACVAAASGYLRDADPRGAALAAWFVGRSCGGAEKIPYLPMFLYGLVIGDPRVAATPPRETKVPLTCVMRGMNYVLMRGDYWDNPDATVVAFGNGRYPYRAMPSNVFALYSRGAPLFLCRANTVFHGYTPPGSNSSNCAYLYRGASEVPDGLLLSPKTYGRDDCERVMQVDSTAGEYDYMVGWRGKYYGTRVADYLKRKTRTLVYLRPRAESARDYVVLLDRVETTDPEIVPHVVFNTVSEPRLAADWAGEDAGKPVHPGQWAAEDAPCVVVTMDHQFKQGGKAALSCHGRAFVRTLWPRAVRTIKIGGLDHFMDDIAGKGSKTHSPCQGFYKQSRDQQIEAGGYWRFHVVPREKATTHAVLNVIEAADSKAAAPAAMELIEGEGIFGALAGPNVVLFSKDGKPLSAGSAKVPGGSGGRAEAQPFRVVVGDLAPGAAYTLTAGEKTVRLVAGKAGSALAGWLDLPAGATIGIVRAKE